MQKLRSLESCLLKLVRKQDSTSRSSAHKFYAFFLDVYLVLFELMGCLYKFLDSQ